MDEINAQDLKIKTDFRRFSIDERELQKGQLSYTSQHQINHNLQNRRKLSDASNQPITLTQSLCFIDTDSPLTSSLSSAFYLKPCCLAAKPPFDLSTENEMLHLLYDDSYTNIMPLTIADENGLCYATLPHGKVIDISSLYFKNNVSSSMFDIQETQSPKEKKIAKVVMVVAVLLLTMCVVLVGVTLSMSGYIDSMGK